MAEPQASETASSLDLDSSPPENAPQIGHGFRKHAFSLETKLTRAFGTTEGGSTVSHNLWLTQIQGGWMLTDPLAEKGWWAGNLEALTQLPVRK